MSQNIKSDLLYDVCAICDISHVGINESMESYSLSTRSHSIKHLSKLIDRCRSRKRMRAGYSIQPSPIIHHGGVRSGRRQSIALEGATVDLFGGLHPVQITTATATAAESLRAPFQEGLI